MSARSVMFIIVFLDINDFLRFFKLQDVKISYASEESENPLKDVYFYDKVSNTHFLKVLCVKINDSRKH